MAARSIHDVHELLRVAEQALASSGAEGDLVYGLLLRLAADPGAFGDDVHLALDAGAEGPRAISVMLGRNPALIVGFVHERQIDFDGLAASLVATGARPVGVSGAVRCAEPCAAAWQSVAGVTLGDVTDMRAFELRALVPPRTSDGHYHEADASDQDVVSEWIHAFGVAIHEPATHTEADRMAARLIDAGDIALWKRNGLPISMAGVNRRTPVSSNIALVYTPPELRGTGGASAVVAALSQRELDRGQSYCTLFTDLANPTSNRIYAAIGYEPRCDFRKTMFAR